MTGRARTMNTLAWSGQALAAVARRLQRIRRNFPSPVTVSRHQDLPVGKVQSDRKREVMAEITWRLVARIGVALSKRVYQVHAVDRSGRVLMGQVVVARAFLGVVRRVACRLPGGDGSLRWAHHIARRLRLMGLDARLIAAHFVTPYRMAGKGGKNGANDAAAICEAACRLHMRFAPVKTAE